MALSSDLCRIINSFEKGRGGKMAASQDLQVPIFSFLTTKIEGGLSIS